MKLLEQKMPKDTLVEEMEGKVIKQGDFVTIYNSSDIVDTYFVDRILEDKAMIIGIKLTPEKDDIVPSKILINLDRLIYIDDSFVNINGALWNMRLEMLPDLL